MKPIVLEPRHAHRDCIGVVRLSRDAEKVVRQLNFKIGLPIRQIVSEIIIQAESLIEIKSIGVDEDTED